MPNIPTANNNPGNIRDTKTGNFIKFDDPGKGWAALMNDVQNKIKGQTHTKLNGDSTLMDFAATWAPDSDGNNSGNYAANLANQLKVRPDIKISELQSRLPEFANAIARHEGWQGEFLKGNIAQSNNDPVTGAFGPPIDAPSPTSTEDIKNPTKGEGVKAVAGMVGNGLLNLGKGVIKGTGQRIASVGDPVVNKLTGLLGGAGSLKDTFIGKLANKPSGVEVPYGGAAFTPNTKAQKAGAFVGRDVLPAAGAVAAGGSGLTALGVDIPAALTAGRGLLSKLIPKGKIGKTIATVAADRIFKGVTGKGLLKYILDAEGYGAPEIPKIPAP